MMVVGGDSLPDLLGGRGIHLLRHRYGREVVRLLDLGLGSRWRHLLLGRTMEREPVLRCLGREKGGGRVVRVVVSDMA